MYIRDFMTSDVSTVRPDQSIQQAAQIMEQIDCGSIPVVEGKRIIGVITDRDIALRGVAAGNTNATVKECMSTNVVTCTPDTDAHEAADLMASKQIRRLPIVDDRGELCGILAIGDLAVISIHVNEAGKALSDISEGSTTTH